STHQLNPLFFEFKEIPIEYFGIITGAIFACSSFGHYFSHNFSEKIGEKTSLVIAALATPALLIPATFLLKWFAAILIIIQSFFFGIRNPIMEHLLNKATNSEKRATVLSIASFMHQLSMACLLPFVGYLADIYSINTAFRISGVLFLLAPILFFFLKQFPKQEIKYTNRGR
ncbi:MFS transporter, partial [Candidatus Peregrinibacteria bacterium]|nr:MFS transporter [Candidatus Peregrinibacteria bacterium]